MTADFACHVILSNTGSTGSIPETECSVGDTPDNVIFIVFCDAPVKPFVNNIELYKPFLEELNTRISTIVDDNVLLLDPKSKNKSPTDKKPKPVLS